MCVCTHPKRPPVNLYRVIKEEDVHYHHLRSLTEERQKNCQFLEQKSRQYARQLKTLQVRMLCWNCTMLSHCGQLSAGEMAVLLCSKTKLGVGVHG